MSGALPTYQVVGPARKVDETVKGMQLVEARAAGLIGVAAAGSVKCLGVATKDATPSATDQDLLDPVSGYDVVNLSPVGDMLTVESSGFWRLKYSGAVAFGERVKCGAAGTVVKWVTGTDGADLIVGRCEEAAGVASGAFGLTKLTL